ncbi:MAG: crossover junction endodeoxyribonuclease RuvC [Candidatus Sungbacteria bacterium]|nr:crossover junction endodeoxyribonuclease RuvC [Candidatus Sungbacteria bacterium]
MIILGIDPGTTSIGYAILKTNPAPHLEDAGLLTVKSADTGSRLKEVHLGVSGLIRNEKPAVFAVERLFFTKNAKTALLVSEARGVILLTTALAGIPTFEYTPLEVKKAVTGDGKADKTQVQKIIQITLPETRTLKARDDVFDAIAVALACFFRERYHFKIQSPKVGKSDKFY